MNAAALILASILAAPSEASAYRTSADLAELEGVSFVGWDEGSFGFALYEEGPPGLAPPTTQMAVTDAARTWAAVECAAIAMHFEGLTETRAAPGDGRNVVEWIRAEWADRGFAADAAAVTDIEYRIGEDGVARIVEADVLLNAADFTWLPGGDTTRSIQSVITHEFGHALGLLHPCGDPGAPDCASDPAFAAVTMYPYYARDQASLDDDDVAGLCSIYPAPACAASCPPGTECVRGDCQPVRCEGSACGCAADAECAAGSRCIDGRCAGVGLPLGNSCSVDPDCATGVCAHHYCTVACAADVDCPANMTCDAMAGACATALGTFGDACEFADDCLTGLCLSGRSTAAFCTEPCGGDAVCPPDFICGNVEAAAICTPRPPASGCSAAGGPSPGAAAAYLVAIACICGRRRRWS